MSFRREGGARLLHFRSEATVAKPILLVPSLINRWYVLDLRPGASLVEALAGAGFDVWLLDWGVPEAEDRYLDWDSVLKRLGRAVRRVQRETAHASIGLLGYCMGGTLSAIYAAQFRWPCRCGRREPRGEGDVSRCRALARAAARLAILHAANRSCIVTSS